MEYCNAHHLRELERAWDQDHQTGTQRMKCLLEEIIVAVNVAGGGELVPDEANRYRQTYRVLLLDAQTECPPPDEQPRSGKRGRVKRSKARNLPERLMNYEDEVLRFMENPIVPYYQQSE